MTTYERRPTGAPSESLAETEPSVTATATHGTHDTLAALADLLRNEGIARANGGMDDWWRSCCDAAIRHLASIGYPFTSDDVADLIPAPEKSSWIGARFHAANAAGVIRVAGFTLSRRPSRHSGVVRIWQAGESL